jgi:pyruvate formate lyase activating enzyme
MREIKKDVLFYEASGGGVTFSGGECMLSIDILEELLKECKSEGIHTAVDTAGRVPYGYFERIIPYTDLFLYDVKMLNSERHKFYTGTDNELILNNLARLLEARAPMIIRIPVIKDVNDSEEEMKGIKDFLDRHGSPLSVELLPYHGMGEYKYTALGRVVPRFSPPDKDRLAMLKGIFQHK